MPPTWSSLGAQAIWQARAGDHGASGGQDLTPGPAPREHGRRTGLRPLRQGLTTNLLNPKIAIFYTSLLPQFIRPGDPVLLRSVTLAGVHVLMGLTWLFWYARVISRLGALLRRPSVRRTTERVTGTVLVTLGIHLALQER